MSNTNTSSIAVQTIPFADVPQFSSRDKAYARNDAKLRPFYKYEVNIETFAKVIADKKENNTNRKVLVEVLKEQYQKFDISEAVQRNIELLAKENTFTIITAHQPSLLTGPLYYIYKIISTINLAKKLKDHYSEYNFVPVFVTGGEDHDFEEVNHTNLFNKRLEWKNEESGSVGMMKTDSLKPVLEELQEILSDSDTAKQVYQLISEAYTKHERYSDATIHLVNGLFGKDGLVVAGMNHAELKRLYIPIIKEEVLEQSSHSLVEETIQQLTEAGFGGQATPREINFFYLREQIRERIVEEDGKFKVLNTDYSFSKEEMIAEIENHPEYFSPNVVMRPLYQELIFPNLAYIGGGGELAYWMERQTQFAHFGLNFPMLIRRNSVLWIDSSNSKKMDKLELSIPEIFDDTNVLIKKHVKANTENELSLKEQKAALNKIYDTVEAKAKEIDSTMVKTVKAEKAKQMNSLNALEAKLLRAEKQRHDIAINQIKSIKDKLFPGNGLQERTDNFLNLYLRYGEEFFEVLKNNLDVLKDGIVVVKD